MLYGEFFRQARKHSGLSQKQVAEKLELYQSNVSDWENDVSRPSYENLIKLSQIYDVTLYELLGEQDPFFRS